MMLNAAEVAKLLGLSPRAVYDLAASGRITSYRMGAGHGALRFEPSDVDEYKKQCRSTGTKRAANGALTSTATSVVNAFGGANFSRPGGREPKQTHSTARKARPCTRSRPASPSLGTTSTTLSIVT